MCVHFKIAIGIILFVATFQIASAQEDRQSRRGSSIVDDSTKMVYSPETTEYTTLDKLKAGYNNFEKADTALFDYHRRFDPVDQSDFLIQDLGNIGTAIRPMFFDIPETVGVRSGYNMYDYYYTKPSERKFFNTKSPHSWFTIFWGGKGRSVTEAGYTRNISPQWNFGFDVKSILVDKIIGRERRGDRNVESMSYNLYSWYRSKDLKYLAMVSYSRMKHQVHEMGGVLTDSVNTPPEFFFERIANSTLQDARSIETRNEVFAHQRYSFTDLFGVFHSLNFGRQVNEFITRKGKEPYYNFGIPVIESVRDTISDKSKLRTIENKVGFTGRGDDFYYEVYYKARHYRQFYKYLYPYASGINIAGREDYGGLLLGGDIDSLIFGSYRAEYLSNGNFRSDLELTSKYGGISWVRSIWAPSFIHQGYLGHYDYWSNDFENVNAYDTRAYLQYETKNFAIRPNIRLQSFDNFTYFRDVTAISRYDQILGAIDRLIGGFPEEQSYRLVNRMLEQKIQEGDTLLNVIPVQDTSTVNITTPGLELNVRFNNIYFNTFGRYTMISSDLPHGFAIPKLHINTRVGYTNIFFNGNLQLQGGLDIHWQSTYYAQGYDPVIQQFYVQREVPVKDYWLFNAFVNVKINRGRAFIKVNNLRKFFNDVGYFVTPYYPGINSLIDIGFNWDFYD